MKAYRTSVKIKLGLIVAAVAIALASLWYTNDLANRISQQEQAAVRLWVRAIEYQAAATALVQDNPYLDTFEALNRVVAAERAEGRLTAADAAAFAEAVAWAETMPPSGELDFVFNEIVEPARFDVPAVITDAALTEVSTARNVDVDSSGGDAAVQRRLLALAREMDTENEPLRFEYLGGGVQLVHYGESALAGRIRWFPFVQLGLVGLFVLVGYLGFSYVRRSEQSSLWVGMAKEAAHQLGTPLSSMMGWIELLRLDEEEGRRDSQTVLIADELDHDVARLRLVADRFQKIGSVPELTPTDVTPIVESVADYVRRRVPREGRHITLDVQAESGLVARLNVHLFEWVVENLLKNALDAIEGDGQIVVEARRDGNEVRVIVRDTGKGIERAAQRHIFRPGFSTKKRGWGLGLSLAKRIVEDYHGGTLVLAESRPGAGATFCISLRAVAPRVEAGDGAPERRRVEAPVR